MKKNLFDYTIQHADNCLILGQRLAEWCGHGPILEQDIALTNISLDLIGQARMFYQYATKIQGEGKTEDELVAFRDAWDYKNVLLVEQPNGDFAHTIFRQFLFDSYSVLFYEMLKDSQDETLSAIAAKANKEASYHVQWSGDWVIRLGDGTQESHRRMQEAIGNLWTYSEELVRLNDVEKIALEEGYGTDLRILQQKRKQLIEKVMDEATLSLPKESFFQSGGKEGIHSEHLGFILSDLQFLQRAYPGQEW